jgi:hypothetical protein
LDDSVRHDRQELAGRSTKNLHKTNKHTVSSNRELLKAHGIMNLLLLHYVRGNAQGQHAEFADAAVN